jgi:hypothetical protein
MPKTFFKFKAHETKSIVSAIFNLNNVTININENTGHAQLIVLDCEDELLLEALNQITTVEAEIDNKIGDRLDLVTNYSRYIYKLNPELKSNKTRLRLLRTLKPIGLFFVIRHLPDTKRFLRLTHPMFLSFLSKWDSIYKESNVKISYMQWKDIYNRDNYDIFITESFKEVVNYVVDKYIIDDTVERRVYKEKLRQETIQRVDFLSKLDY